MLPRAEHALEAVEIGAGGEGAGHVAVAAVGRVADLRRKARRLEPVDVRHDRARVAAGIAAGAGLARVVPAVAGDHVQPRALRLAGDDVDHAADRVAAVDRRARSLDDLDVVDEVRVDVLDGGVALRARIDAHAVDQHDGLVGVRAADEQRGLGAAAAHHVDAGVEAQQVADVAARRALDRVAVDDDGRRQRLELQLGSRLAVTMIGSSWPAAVPSGVAADAVAASRTSNGIGQDVAKQRMRSPSMLARMDWWQSRGAWMGAKVPGRTWLACAHRAADRVPGRSPGSRADHLGVGQGPVAFPRSHRMARLLQWLPRRGAADGSSTRLPVAGAASEWRAVPAHDDVTDFPFHPGRASRRAPGSPRRAGSWDRPGGCSSI